MTTAWKVIKATTAGIGFAIASLLAYAICYGIINFQSQHATEWHVMTVYQPWFWIFMIGGFGFGAYLVTRELKVFWKTTGAIFSGLVFALSGYTLYFWRITRHTYLTNHEAWKTATINSPICWICTLSAGALGVFLATRRRRIS